MLLTTVLFIFILGILVFVHEAGHFFAAKIAGIKVEEFAFGFPPRLFSKKRGETVYSINAIPIGGYVRLLGESDESKNKRSFSQKSPFSRAMVSVAGVIMHLVLAWLIFAIGFSIGMTPMVTSADKIPGKIISNSIIISETTADSPASKAGFAPGDNLLSASSAGEEIVVFQNASEVTNYSKNHFGKEVEFVYLRDKSEQTAKVILSGDQSAPFGVGMIDNSVVKVSWYFSPIVAFREIARIVWINLQFLGSFFVQLFSRGEISKEVGGPVAIYIFTGMAARAGAMVFLQFVAILSVSLALINILPFPALDGGRLLFIILEKIFRKKVITEKVENIIHSLGFILIIIFAIAVTYKDVIKFVIKK